jgi:hypothetical protein
MKKIVTLGLSAIAATLISTSASAFFNRTVVDPAAESRIAEAYKDPSPEALAKFSGPMQTMSPSFGEGGTFFFTYALKDMKFTTLINHNIYLWENFMQYGLIMDRYTAYITVEPTEINDDTITTAVVSVFMPFNKEDVKKVICEDDVRNIDSLTDTHKKYKKIMCEAVEARINHLEYLEENPPEEENPALRKSK